MCGYIYICIYIHVYIYIRIYIICHYKHEYVMSCTTDFPQLIGLNHVTPIEKSRYTYEYVVLCTTDFQHNQLEWIMSHI